MTFVAYDSKGRALYRIDARDGKDAWQQIADVDSRRPVQVLKSGSFRVERIDVVTGPVSDFIPWLKSKVKAQ